MSELILRGLDLFLDKTHSAGKLSISPEITETVFLVLGFLLVFAGAKLYRVVISLVMFIGITLLFCTNISFSAKITYQLFLSLFETSLHL